MNDPFDYSDEAKSSEAGSFDQQPSASRTARFASYLAIAALLFTALGVTVGYKHWLRISDRAKLAIAQITVMQQQLDEKADQVELQKVSQDFRSISQAHDETLQTTLAQVQALKEATVYAASTVSTQIEELTELQAGPPQIRTRMTRAEARLAEIRFLLESATNRLALLYDKKGALALLKSADLMLVRMGSTDLLPVREKLAKDISQLEKFALPDISELLATVTSIEKGMTPLADVGSIEGTSNTVHIFNPSEQDNSLASKIKNYVNDSITITKDPQSPKETLSLANKQRTDQLMKLRLTALRLNIMERQDSEFHYQIKEILKMLDKYYLEEQQIKSRKELSLLDSLTLNPELPSIDSALQLIKNGLGKDNQE